MNQVYTPNFGVGATRGWCLKYVDDGGAAPTRRPTARAAFDAENNAGRIRGGDGPLDVWVVGFLDFTAGPYTKEGHVFFMKFLGGGRYEIRDSEVGAGARKVTQNGKVVDLGPYGSLAELTAWFGAYKPRYTGWSTDCDGRNYAKEGGTSMADITKKEAEMLTNVMRVLNSEAKGWNFNDVHAGKFDQAEVNFLAGKRTNAVQAIADYSQQAWEEGHNFRVQRGVWKDFYDKYSGTVPKLEQALATAKSEIESLKKQLAERPENTSEEEKKLDALRDALNAVLESK